MDDTFIIIIIIFAICYILFSMYKKDYFIVQPHNNTIHHLPYNHYEPPNIYNLSRNKSENINKSDNINKGDNNTLTLNDIDDIIHNYENIGYTNTKSEIKRNNNKREENDNIINFNKHQIENRNINKYRNCNINNKEKINEIKEVYINDERRNNRNKYANFKDKVYRNGVVYTSVDKLAAIRSDPYDNNIGNIGDTISSIYDNLLSTTYDK
jgi:hypothetical protein